MIDSFPFAFFVIWNGGGVLALVFLFVGFLSVQLAVDEFLGENYYQKNTWPKIFGLLLGVALTWVMGRQWNRRPLLGKIESWREEFFGAKHSLFFIAMEWWAMVALLFYAYLAFE